MNEYYIEATVRGTCTAVDPAEDDSWYEENVTVTVCAENESDGRNAVLELGYVNDINNIKDVDIESIEETKNIPYHDIIIETRNLSRLN